MKNLDLDLEIYDLWYEPFWQSKIFCLTLIFIILILLIFVFIYIKRKNKKIENTEITTFSDVLDKIYLMQISENCTQEECKKFYTELTFYLKKFLSLYAVQDFNSKTEDEIINYLVDNNFSPDFIQTFKDILSGASVVKFANEQAIILQMNTDLEKIIKIIKQAILLKK